MIEPFVDDLVGLAARVSSFKLMANPNLSMIHLARYFDGVGDRYCNKHTN